MKNSGFYDPGLINRFFYFDWPFIEAKNQAVENAMQDN
jgi:hypothetical protein